MRTEWIPLSAAALVTGVMALVLGALLNPVMGDATPAEAIQVADQQGARWLAMAIMYFLGSVALTLGMPTLLSLLTGRGRVAGLLGVALFAIGIVGMAGYAMLMVFYKALLVHGAINPDGVERVSSDVGLLSFLWVWVAGFLLGLLLIALALFQARKTGMWVPVLIVVFVVLTPFASLLDRAGTSLQMLTLAAAFTGIATSATSPEHRADLRRALV